MLVVIQVSGEMEWFITCVYGHLYLNGDLVRFSQRSLCVVFTESIKPSVVMQGRDWRCSW